MIICNSRKFIFVHINKTAGTSVTAALDPHLEWNDIVLGETPIGQALNRPFKQRFGLYKHSTAREIRSVVGADVWKNYLKFAVLRDPIDRTVSLYLYIQKIQSSQPELRRRLRSLLGKPSRKWPAAQVLEETDGFSAFVRHPRIHDDPGFISQKAFICDDAGEVIVDRILRFETVEEDFRAVCLELGLPAAQIGHVNKSGDVAGHRPHVSKVDADFLKRHFAEDYALLEAVLTPRQKTDDLSVTPG